jgi:hypothetical protein
VRRRKRKLVARRPVKEVGSEAVQLRRPLVLVVPQSRAYNLKANRRGANSWRR